MADFFLQTLAQSNSGVWARLMWGCPFLDGAWSGGIVSNGIVEFAGAAGTGKTQVAMWLASRALARDEESSVIYVGTEGEFPHKRFKQMASTLISKRLILERVDSLDALQEWLQTRFPVLVNKTKARLLIIDSIGALRSDFGDAETPQRAQALWKLAYSLKWIIDTHACGVCVTNQVVSVMGSITEEVSWSYYET